jgi:hypothetical protein
MAKEVLMAFNYGRTFIEPTELSIAFMLGVSLWVSCFFDKVDQFGDILALTEMNFTRQRNFRLNKNLIVNNIESIKAESINIQRLQQKHKLAVGEENLKKEMVKKYI